MKRIRKPLAWLLSVMLIFTALGVLSILFASLLKRENTIKGYGLELPNIQK